MKRIEYRAIELLDQLDEFHLYNIVRSFSRHNSILGFGDDQTFVKLEQRITKLFDKFDLKTLSYIMHAYSNRQQGNPELHKKYIDKIRETTDFHDYQVLSNVIYYLMFETNKDYDIWLKVVKQTLKMDGIIPIRYFKPFKMSKYYIQHHFKDLDITDYCLKFYHPERYYNSLLKEQKMGDSESKVEFFLYLLKRLFLVPVNYLVIHNVFLLRACMHSSKVAINFYSKAETLASSGRIPSKELLNSKILSYEGWEILDISETYNSSMLTTDRDNFYREWLKSAKEKQIKKGIIREIPKAI